MALSSELKGALRTGQCVCAAAAASVLTCCVSDESETLSLESRGLSVNLLLYSLLKLCSLGKLLKISGLLFPHL